MPDIGFVELLIIGAVALIVVGPQDLPLLLRRLGQFTGRARALMHEFRQSMDEAGRQAEMEALKREVEKLKREGAEAMSAVQNSIHMPDMPAPGTPSGAPQASPETPETSQTASAAAPEGTAGGKKTTGPEPGADSDAAKTGAASDAAKGTAS